MFIEKMNIVFHVAATIAFNQPLNEAVDINTKGTSRIIDLYKELKHVIYVSTASSTLAQLILMLIYQQSKKKFT